MAFENFFTTYDMVEPPAGYKDNPNLKIPDIEETNFTQYPMVTTIDNPTMVTDLEDFPGVISPFDIQVGEPFKRTEITRTGNKANDVVNLARTFLDKPYVWGSMDPNKGFDCSGLINYVYQQIGIQLPRTSHAMAKVGTEVQLSDVQPGDIIYTSSKGPSGGHVKMVSSVANGQISVIEAKGKKWGIVESILTNTSNIKSIRRVLDPEFATSVPEPFQFWRHVLDAGYGGGDTAGKNYYWRSPTYGGTFNEAFAQAVQNKDEDFWWNGNIYNTKQKPSPSVPVQDNSKYTHRFKSKNFDEFVEVMYPIFEEALTSKGYPTTQIQNLIRQAALESTYGTDPRGTRGYNLGGIKWDSNPNSRTHKYKHSTGPDGIEYVDFDNLRDYADYKVYLLDDTYKALNARDTNDFVRRLHGGNPSKKSYSSNPEGYMKNLNGMVSLDRAYNNYVAKRKQSR